MGTRKVPFTKELYIERNDFSEDPPKKFFRLAIGREVRLRYSYYITCTDVIKNDNGEIIELHCTYDPESRGGSTPDGRKVRGTIHWVSALHALNVTVRLYDRLFSDPEPKPGQQDNDITLLNPDSLRIVTNCKIEPGLSEAVPGINFQFERLGYFCIDSFDSNADNLVFNRTIPLRDSWAKMQNK